MGILYYHHYYHFDVCSKWGVNDEWWHRLYAFQLWWQFFFTKIFFKTQVMVMVVLVECVKQWHCYFDMLKQLRNAIPLKNVTTLIRMTSTQLPPCLYNLLQRVKVQFNRRSLVNSLRGHPHDAISMHWN